MDKNEQIARNTREQIFNAIHFNAQERHERIADSLIIGAIEEAMNAEFIDRWNDIERLKTENQRTKQT